MSELDPKRELSRARLRAAATFVVMLLIGATFLHFRACAHTPDDGTCETSVDCNGVIGVECLHAPTGAYCTHTCGRDEECDRGFHCDAPAWEKDATHTVCMRNVISSVK